MPSRRALLFGAALSIACAGSAAGPQVPHAAAEAGPPLWPMPLRAAQARPPLRSFASAR